MHFILFGLYWIIHIMAENILQIESHLCNDRITWLETSFEYSGDIRLIGIVILGYYLYADNMDTFREEQSNG